MNWLTGIVSLALMLAILELDPNQLEFINNTVKSHYWQTAAQITMALAFIILGVSYFIKSKALNPAFTSKSLTPVHTIYQYGLIPLLCKFFGILLFCSAILFNAVAQRIEHIESTPKHLIYVEAVVTPIGLSDKRLQLERLAPSDENPTPQSIVQQGYRQLVHLTDIKRYSSIQTNDSDGDNDTQFSHDAVVTLANNPFTIGSTIPNDTKGEGQFLNSELNPDPNSNVKNFNSAQEIIHQTDLPPSMTVMLQSYDRNHEWLNDLSVDKQVRMRLLLTPLQYEVITNKNEFNEYRWLSSRHASATAQLIEADPSNIQPVTHSNIRKWVDTQRSEFRAYFLEFMNESSLLNTSNSNVINAISLDSHEVKQVTLQGSKDDTLQPLKSKQTLNHTQTTQTSRNDAIAVTLSLLTGDRSLISRDITDLYRFAGISHLLAISGTHVLFLALLCAGSMGALISLVKPELYRLLPRWQLAFITAVIVAFGYAIFAGFDIPAARTAMMLVAIGILRYLLAIPSIFKVLMGMAVAMAWFDIFVLWQAGFWLSFIAVAILVIYGQRWEKSAIKEGKDHSTVMNSLTSKLKPPKNLANQTNRTNRNDRGFRNNYLDHLRSFWIASKQGIVALVKLQIWMSVALLPLSLWLFGKVSLWGFIVNIFAIGLFGWVIVPLNLLAGVLYLLFPMYPNLANSIWKCLFWILETLHTLLFKLQLELKQSGWLYSEMSLSVLILILLASIPWILPKGMINKLASIAPLLLIGLVKFVTSIEEQNNLRITSLNPKNVNISANLIYDAHHSWLVLSAYRRGYDQQYQTLTEDQVHLISQTLYDQLKHHNIDDLTGIIVQTATSNLAPVVEVLNNSLDMSYYWQAGLRNSENQIISELNTSSLTPQSCSEGKLWQPGSNLDNSLPSFSLISLTGWEEVEDSSIWDCTIMINTRQKVQEGALGHFKDLALASEPLQLIDNVSSSNDPSSQTSNATLNYPNRTITGDSASAHLESSQSSRTKSAGANHIILFASDQPKLATLWQLMCRPIDPLPLDFNKSSLTDSSLTDSVMDSSFSISNQHWLTTSRASIDKSLIDFMSPITWQVLDEDKVPSNSKFKEVRLYWQQHYQ